MPDNVDLSDCTPFWKWYYGVGKVSCPEKVKVRADITMTLVTSDEDVFDSLDKTKVLKEFRKGVENTVDGKVICDEIQRGSIVYTASVEVDEIDIAKARRDLNDYNWNPLLNLLDNGVQDSPNAEVTLSSSTNGGGDDSGIRASDPLGRMANTEDTQKLMEALNSDTVTYPEVHLDLVAGSEGGIKPEEQAAWIKWYDDYYTTAEATEERYKTNSPATRRILHRVGAAVLRMFVGRGEINGLNTYPPDGDMIKLAEGDWGEESRKQLIGDGLKPHWVTYAEALDKYSTALGQGTVTNERRSDISEWAESGGGFRIAEYSSDAVTNEEGQWIGKGENKGDAVPQLYNVEILHGLTEESRRSKNYIIAHKSGFALDVDEQIREKRRLKAASVIVGARSEGDGEQRHIVLEVEIKNLSMRIPRKSVNHSSLSSSEGSTETWQFPLTLGPSPTSTNLSFLQMFINQNWNIGYLDAVFDEVIADRNFVVTPLLALEGGVWVKAEGTGHTTVFPPPPTLWEDHLVVTSTSFGGTGTSFGGTGDPTRYDPGSFSLFDFSTKPTAKGTNGNALLSYKDRAPTGEAFTPDDNFYSYESSYDLTMVRYLLLRRAIKDVFGTDIDDELFGAVKPWSPSYPPLKLWNTSNITSMRYLFSNADRLGSVKDRAFSSKSRLGDTNTLHFVVQDSVESLEADVLKATEEYDNLLLEIGSKYESEYFELITLLKGQDPSPNKQMLISKIETALLFWFFNLSWVDRGKVQSFVEELNSNAEWAYDLKYVNDSVAPLLDKEADLAKARNDAVDALEKAKAFRAGLSDNSLDVTSIQAMNGMFEDWSAFDMEIFVEADGGKDPKLVKAIAAIYEVQLRNTVAAQKIADESGSDDPSTRARKKKTLDDARAALMQYRTTLLRDASGWNGFFPLLESTDSMFSGCHSLQYPPDLGMLSGVKSASNMFQYCYKLTDPDGILNRYFATYYGTNFDHLYSVARMFAECKELDCDLNWKVDTVTSLNGLFQGCSKFTGKGLGNWKLLSVAGLDLDISRMFYGCRVFGSDVETGTLISLEGVEEIQDYSPTTNDITGWDTQRVKSMARTFQGALQFNQNIGGWNVGSSTDMTSTFESARSFNQSLVDWDTKSAVSMERMFYGAGAFEGPDLADWNTSEVTDMHGMFWGATSFEGNGIGKWDTRNVDDMSFMFKDASSFEGNGIGEWDVSMVITMKSMFEDAKKFTGAGLKHWERDRGEETPENPRPYSTTDRVSNMRDMFWGAESFCEDIGDWDITALGGTNSIDIDRLEGRGLSEESILQFELGYDAALRLWYRNRKGPEGEAIREALTLFRFGITRRRFGETHSNDCIRNVFRNTGPDGTKVDWTKLNVLRDEETALINAIAAFKNSSISVNDDARNRAIKLLRQEISGTSWEGLTADPQVGKLKADSYLTILGRYSEDYPQLFEDSRQPISVPFQTNGVTEIRSDTLTGASWYVINVNPRGLPNDNLEVMIMQLTTKGDITGNINVQIFPLGITADQVRLTFPLNDESSKPLTGQNIAATNNPNSPYKLIIRPINYGVTGDVGTSYRFFIKMSDPTDRLSAVLGDDKFPLVINVPSGLYNNPLNTWAAREPKKIVDNLIATNQERIKLAADSYLTILGRYSEDYPQLVEDAEQPITVPFQTNGAIEIKADTGIGASWYVLHTNPRGLPNDDLEVMIMQLTTKGLITGQINAQIFPLGNGDDQVRLTFPLNDESSKPLTGQNIAATNNPDSPYRLIVREKNHGVTAAVGTSYQFFIKMSDPTDRLSAVFGNKNNPLVVEAPSGLYNNPLNLNGVWEADGVDHVRVLNADSYLTILGRYSEDYPQIAEDLGQPISVPFQTNGVTEIRSDTLTGASWYVLNSNPRGLPNDNLEVMIMQLTTKGDITGNINAQVYPLGVGADQVQLTFPLNNDSSKPLTDQNIDATDNAESPYKLIVRKKDHGVTATVGTSYQFFIKMSDPTDRLSAVFGNDITPLVINVPSGLYNNPLNLNGVWETTYVPDDDDGVDHVRVLNADSYMTILGRSLNGNVKYTNDNDARQPISVPFTVDGATEIRASGSGGAWFPLSEPGGKRGLPDGNLRVLIMQLTTMGPITGQINVAIYPLGNADDQVKLTFPLNDGSSKPLTDQSIAATNNPDSPYKLMIERVDYGVTVKVGTSYRFYIQMSDPSDRLHSVFGDTNNPLVVEAPSGLYNNPLKEYTPLEDKAFVAVALLDFMSNDDESTSLHSSSRDAAILVLEQSLEHMRELIEEEGLGSCDNLLCTSWSIYDKWNQKYNSSLRLPLSLIRGLFSLPKPDMQMLGGWEWGQAPNECPTRTTE